MSVPVQRLPHSEGLPLPSYATEGAAALDLCAALPENTSLRLKSFERTSVPTGIGIALPEGYEAQVRPRSGLALKQGLTILNSPGTIDADYRGEIKVLLINLGADEVIIERGMRIAQLVVAPVTCISWDERSHLDETGRADSGFGSTGVRAPSPSDRGATSQ